MKDKPAPPTPVERRRRELILRIIVLTVVLITMAIVGGVALWATWEGIWLPKPIEPVPTLILGFAPRQHRRRHR